MISNENSNFEQVLCLNTKELLLINYFTIILIINKHDTI